MLLAPFDVELVLLARGKDLPGEKVEEIFDKVIVPLEAEIETRVAPYLADLDPEDEDAVLEATTAAIHVQVEDILKKEKII